MHDPTTLNRQGNDVGTQYRSAIFFHTAEQKAVADAVIGELGAARVFADPIVTQVVPLAEFHSATTGKLAAAEGMMFATNQLMGFVQHPRFGIAAAEG